MLRRTIKSTLVMSPRVSTLYKRCPAIKFLGELNKHLMSVSPAEKEISRETVALVSRLFKHSDSLASTQMVILEFT